MVCPVGVGFGIPSLGSRVSMTSWAVWLLVRMRGVVRQLIDVHRCESVDRSLSSKSVGYIQRSRMKSHRMLSPLSPRCWSRPKFSGLRRKPTESLDPTISICADREHRSWTVRRMTKAPIFLPAHGVDADYAASNGMPHIVYSLRMGNGWMRTGVRNAEPAVWRGGSTHGEPDAVASGTSGFTLAYVGRELEGGAALIDRALAQNPNLGNGVVSSGFVSATWTSQNLRCSARACDRLSPVDPRCSPCWPGRHKLTSSPDVFDEAVSWGQSGPLSENSAFLPAVAAWPRAARCRTAEWAQQAMATGAQN